MKRMCSLLLVVVMMLNMFMPTVFAEDNNNSDTQNPLPDITTPEETLPPVQDPPVLNSPEDIDPQSDDGDPQDDDADPQDDDIDPQDDPNLEFPEPIPVNPHVMTNFPAVEKTCEEDGNTEYWYCTICDKYFSDEEGNNEIEKDSWITPAEHHRYTIIGSDRVDASVISAALGIPGFNLLSVVSLDSSVVIEQTGTGFEVVVDKNSASVPREIKLIGTDESQHIVYINSDMTRLTSQYFNAYFTVRWNDNGGDDPASIAPRPALDDIKDWYHLLFKIDGSNEYYSFENLLDITGIKEPLAFDPKNFDLFDYADTGNITKWTFNLSGLGLPRSYEKDGVSHSIEYFIEQKDPHSDKTQFDNYTFNNFYVENDKMHSDVAPNIAVRHNDVDANINADKTGHAEEILNNSQYRYKANVTWRDNDNKYGTRPDLLKSEPSLQVNYGGKFEDIEDPLNFFNGAQRIYAPYTGSQSKYSVQYFGIPAFNKEGKPLYYGLHRESTFATADREGKTATEKYDLIYVNQENYASFEDEICDGGEVTITLADTLPLTYSKVWHDELDESEYDKRPNERVYLYVITEDKVIEAYNAHGTFSTVEASAVDGYTTMDVPKHDEENIVLMESVQKYDELGRRLVYYGYEVGASKDYITGVDNDESIYKALNADVISAFDMFESSYVNHFELKDDGSFAKYPKYFLPGATIDNRQSATTTVRADVTINAVALQTMKQADVTLKLEKLVEDEDGTYKWVPVTYGDYVRYNGPEDKTEQVVKVLDEFRSEAETLSTVSEQLLKYDENGKLIVYRWTETNAALNGSEQKDIGWGMNNPDVLKPAQVYDFETTENVSLGKFAPGVGGTNVDVYLSGTMHNAYGDQWVSTIVNTINAPLLIKVVKEWIDENGNVSYEVGEAGGKITCSIYRDGVLLEENVVIDNEYYDTDSKSWVYIDGKYPRFDENGREYKYTIQEISADDGGYTDLEWASNVNYSSLVAETGKDDETAKELLAEISNTIAPVPGESFDLSVQKKWLDGGDLLSRKPVYAGLFNIEKGAILGIYELNTANIWYKEVTVYEGQPYYTFDGSAWEIAGNLESDDVKDKADNYVLIEVGTGPSGLSLSSFTDTSTMLYYNGKTFFAWAKEDIQALAGAASGTALSKVGYIALNDTDPDGNSEYSYEVYGSTAASIKGGSCTTWTNKRFARLSLELVKTWADGGSYRAGQFTLYRSQLGSHQASEALYTFTTDAQEKYLDTDETVYLSVTESAGTGKQVKIEISGLEKYDANGEPFSYTLKETGIYKKGDSRAPEDMIPVSGGGAYVEGENYAVSCMINASRPDSVYGTVYGPIHHDGDVTYWRAANNLSQSYPLQFYKVWYDDAKPETIKNRPNIYFNVYRITTNLWVKAPDLPIDSIYLLDWLQSTPDEIAEIYGEEYRPYAYSNKLFSDFIADYYNSGNPVLVENYLTISSDRFYDASNQWLWDIDIGTVSKYDPDGYPYVYFVVEDGIGPTSQYYGNQFYGNMKAAELSPTPTAGAKHVYDIYDDRQFSTVYGNATVLIVSDGVHTPGGIDDPGKYYSRTVVNARENERAVSGRKLWEIPSGWTIKEDDFPKLEMELWRGTTPIELSQDGDYTIEQFNTWRTAGDAEHVCDFTLNTDETGWNKFEDYNFLLEYASDPSSGTVPKMERYDRYGSLYEYYIVEKGSVNGYPANDTEYNKISFYVKNCYKIEDPYVQISGEKEWKISDEMKAQFPDLKLENLAPVTVSLYAQTVDKDRHALAGADPILIATRTLTPDEDGKVDFVFDKYEKYAAENTRIPYYGPNGEPFAFYLTETHVNGYSEKISVNGEAAVNYDASQNYYVNITLDSTDNMYKNGNKVVFENTYIGEKTTFPVEKLWNDGYVDNSQYRPDSLTVTIMRKSGSPAVTDPNFSTSITINKTNATNANSWKYTFENLTKYDKSGAAFVYYIDSESITTSLGTVTAKQAGDKIGNYELTATSAGKFENTLAEHIRLSLEKDWTFRKTPTGDAVNVSWNDFLLLKRFNTLPDSVKYVVKRSVNGSEWAFVSGSDADSKYTVNVGGNTVVGFEVNISALDKVTFYELFDTRVSWEPLPAKDADGNAYTYRIEEIMTWADGSVTYSDGSKAHGVSATIGAPAKKGDTNEYTVKANNFIDNKVVRFAKEWVDEMGYDNTRPSSLTMKLRNKASNPELSLSYVLKTSGATPTVIDSKYHSKYYSDYFFLPGTVDAAQLLNDYEVTETVIEGYSKKITDGHDYTVTAENENSFVLTMTNEMPNTTRKVIKLSATKNWSSDTMWKEITRPKVRFTLQYQDKNASGESGWHDMDTLTESELEAFTAEKGAAMSFEIAADAAQSELTKSWTDLYKYWPLDDSDVDGVPEVIKYRVKETLLYGTTDISGASSYTPTVNNTKTSYITYQYASVDSADEEYSGTIRNTLQRKAFTLKKQWTENDTAKTISGDDVKKLIALNALPEKLTFVIEYRLQINNATEESAKTWSEWNPIPVTKISGGITVENGKLTVSTEALIGGVSVPAELVQYDNKGHKISYRIYEESMQYKGAETPVTVTVDWNEAKTVGKIGSITAKASDPFGSGTTSITLSNAYAYVERKAFKEWNDGNNRDNSRKPFSAQLYRDGVKYGSVLSTDNPTTRGNEFCSVTPGAEGTEWANIWTVEWKYLPKYKVDVIPGGTETESVYTWEEVVVPTDYTKDPAHTAPLGMDVHEKNTYVPKVVDKTARKEWSDFDDKFNLRPESVSFKLQYSVDNGTTWVDLKDENCLRNTAVSVLTEKDADKVYMVSNDAIVQELKADVNGKFGEAVWHNLTKYVRINGVTTEVKYKAVEVTELKHYDNTEGEDENGLFVTNTLKTGNIEVKKNFTENSSPIAADVDYGTVLYMLVKELKILPETLNVKLEAVIDGTKYSETKEMKFVSDAGAKTGSYANVKFYNLPVKDSSGADIEYTITDSAAGYEFITCTAATAKLKHGETVSVALTNNFNTCAVTVEKKWLDENDRDLGRTPIKVQLFTVENGVETAFSDVVELNAGNGWQYTWAKVTVLNNENIRYVVREIIGDTPVVQGGTYTGAHNIVYSVNYPQNDGMKFEPKQSYAMEVQNTHVPEKGRITANKEWIDDNNNAYLTRPDEIEFKLQYTTNNGVSWTDITKGTLENNRYADDNVYTTSAPVQKLTKADWNATRAWENLPYTALGGKTVEYRIIETDVTGYTAVYSATKVVPTESGTNIKVKNSPETTELILKKTWVGASEFITPTAVTFKLEYRIGDGNWTALPAIGDVQEGGYVTLAAADAKADGSWEKTIPNLPVVKSRTVMKDGKPVIEELEYSYRAVETSIQYNGNSSNILKTGTYTASVVTAKGTDGKWHADAVNTLETGSIEVLKTWADGNDRDNMRADSVTVQLYRDGKPYGEAKVLNDDTEWKAKWDKLPLYSDAGTATKSIYNISEIKVGDTDTSDSVYTPKIMLGDADIAVSGFDLTKDSTKEPIITNTYVPKRFMAEATKAWSDGGNKYGLRPSSVELTLEWTIKDPAVADDWKSVEHVDEVPLPSADDGLKVFTTSSVKQTIKGSASSNTWSKAVWNDIPGYTSSGNVIYYRAVETSVPEGYETEFTATNVTTIKAPKALSVKNTLVPTKLTVNKVWEPSAKILDQYKALPDYIAVLLEYSKDGVNWTEVPENDLVVISADSKGEFTYTFENLNSAYKYRALEVAVVYGEEVIETVFKTGTNEAGTVGGFDYSAKTVLDTKSGEFTTTITNSLDLTKLTVNKIWNDNNNSGKIRPKTITVELHRIDIAGTTKTDYVIDTVEISAASDGSWSYSWTDLPAKSNDGKSYAEYYVSEKAVSGYTASYKTDGQKITITNTHKTPPGVRTGDDTNLLTYLLLTVLSFFGLVSLPAFRKKE